MQIGRNNVFLLPDEKLANGFICFFDMIDKYFF